MNKSSYRVRGIALASVILTLLFLVLFAVPSCSFSHGWSVFSDALGVNLLASGGGYNEKNVADVIEIAEKSVDLKAQTERLIDASIVALGKASPDQIVPFEFFPPDSDAYGEGYFAMPKGAYDGYAKGEDPVDNNPDSLCYRLSILSRREEKELAIRLSQKVLIPPTDSRIVDLINAYQSAKTEDEIQARNAKISKFTSLIIMPMVATEDNEHSKLCIFDEIIPIIQENGIRESDALCFSLVLLGRENLELYTEYGQQLVKNMLDILSCLEKPSSSLNYPLSRIVWWKYNDMI